ncbi:DNA repair protein RecN [Desulfatiglans anilini]|uniref:DNA repair protein RecN n=1 Tax=Desulfatiglans anilini TaxID=90728 RepID=UPI000401569D|nr:DNA repair protein RecN [Desulfatiglans anilini]
MLVHLGISNFALIEHVEITPGQDLSIFSGETGAGKSIIINAINLILGARASTDLIRTGADEATVEALFSLPESAAVQASLEDMGFPFDGELLIRRSIFREGRNKIFVNGLMATLGMLAKLGPVLVSISGQHEHQQLLRPDNHLYLLDDFAGLTPERERYNANLQSCRSLRRQADEARSAVLEMEKRDELNRYQLEEIEAASLAEVEEEELIRERRRLQHAGELLKISAEAYHRLYEHSESILAQLAHCRKQLERGADLDPTLAPLLDTLLEVDAKLEDAAFALRDFQNTIPLDPVRLSQVTDRLEQIHQLKRKYGCSIRDILLLRDTLAEVSEDLERKRKEAAFLSEKADACMDELSVEAARLSELRRESAREMESRMEQELRMLHMEGTRFKVAFQAKTPGEAIPGKGAALNRHLPLDGPDQVEFLLAPNAGEGFRPLAKIASGGELSRIMLALKTLLAQSASVETVIFDEVDAGISGATAQIVGEKIKALSRYHQIICITHLPQIASQGSSHFLVRKDLIGTRTQTSILPLDPESRVKEIARLLAGREVTPHALAQAREMLR